MSFVTIRISWKWRRLRFFLMTSAFLLSKILKIERCTFLSDEDIPMRNNLYWVRALSLKWVFFLNLLLFYWARTAIHVVEKYRTKWKKKNFWPNFTINNRYKESITFRTVLPWFNRSCNTYSAKKDEGLVFTQISLSKSVNCRVSNHNGVSSMSEKIYVTRVADFHSIFSLL